MDAQLNRKSLMFGVPGIILQIVGWVMNRGDSAATIRNAPPAESNVLALVITVIGTVLLIYGLALYAKAKGYHPLFGLFGLLSIIGLIVLGVLPDKLKAPKK